MELTILLANTFLRGRLQAAMTPAVGDSNEREPRLTHAAHFFNRAQRSRARAYSYFSHFLVRALRCALRSLFPAQRSLPEPG